MRHLYFNIPIDTYSREEIVKIFKKIISGNECSLLFFLNAHCFNIAQKNKKYHQALLDADIVLNDGIGLKLGSYFTSLRFKDNLNGTDLIPQIIKSCYDMNKRVYLLGGKPGVAILAKRKLEKLYPSLSICGAHHGYFSQYENEIILDINRSKADVLIVGMGVPLQELWLTNNRSEFSNLKLCIAGGAIIDFLSGTVPRAPLWLRKMNLEWFYRLLLEPERMWRRYVIGNFIFFWNIFSFTFINKKKNQVKSLQSTFKPVEKSVKEPVAQPELDSFAAGLRN